MCYKKNKLKHILYMHAYVTEDIDCEITSLGYCCQASFYILGLTVDVRHFITYLLSYYIHVRLYFLMLRPYFDVRCVPRHQCLNNPV